MAFKLSQTLLICSILVLRCFGQDDQLNLPRGRMGVKWDTGTQRDTWWHFSSVIKKMTDGNNQDVNLGDTNAFSDNKLTAVAMDGLAEMDAIMNAINTPQDNRPTVMTALEVSGEIYLSSSIKRNGPGFRALFPNSIASIALERCSAVSCNIAATPRAKKDGSMHRTGGNCGEAGAVHMWWKDHQDANPGALPDGARIVAVRMFMGQTVVVPPCGQNDLNVVNDNPEWGCERFLTDLNIRAIDSTTQRDDVPNDWQIQAEVVCL